MENYADVLESYVIAEEGFGDIVKKAGKAIGKAFLAVIAFIRKILGQIGAKIRALFSRKEKKEKPKDTIARLEREKAELQKQASGYKSKYEDESNRSRDVDDASAAWQKKYDKEVRYRKAEQQDKTRLFNQMERMSSENRSLQERIEQINKRIEEAKAADKKLADYDRFVSYVLKFTVHVTTQTNKAYTALPKLVAEAKKFDGKDKDSVFGHKGSDEGESFYDKLQESLPTMHSGQWSFLYKTLRYSYLPRIKDDAKYIQFTADMARGLEALVKQSTQTIDYLEKLASGLNADNNPAVEKILRHINKEEGFIDMLKASLTLSNQILNCYTTHDVFIPHNTHDAV